MRKILICISAIALSGTSAGAMAQMAGNMATTETGTTPLAGTSAQNYVAWAADSDMYELQSSKLALTKAKSKATKDFAREMIADHMQTTRSLMAALPKTEPKVARPGKALSEPNAAKIAALKATPADGFDTLYMQQQTEAHKAAWALHKGYAADGQDPALRQVATSAVPIIEKHIAHAQGGAMGTM